MVEGEKVCRNCGHDAVNIRKRPSTPNLRKCSYCGLLVRADELEKLPTFEQWSRNRQGLTP
jgi:dissimilatory sulfite reductase (desulfoviridin) alpha/beta subunit